MYDRMPLLVTTIVKALFHYDDHVTFITRFSVGLLSLSTSSHSQPSYSSDIPLCLSLCSPSILVAICIHMHTFVHRGTHMYLCYKTVCASVCMSVFPHISSSLAYKGLTFCKCSWGGHEFFFTNLSLS